MNRSYPKGINAEPFGFAQESLVEAHTAFRQAQYPQGIKGERKLNTSQARIYNQETNNAAVKTN
jgi:hypothetical protein